MTTIAPAPAGLSERRLDAGVADRLSRIPVPLISSAWNAGLIPAEYLPVLAWALSVDEWSPDWDAAAKRAVIHGAIAAHRLKGTAAGVKGVLDRIGAVYDYVERPADEPFTAKVTVYNSSSLRLSDAASIRGLVDAHKRASVTMTISATAGLAGEIPIAGGLGAATVARLDLDART